MKKNKKPKVVVRDPNAKAMWGKVKAQTFKDKTKYTRKQKHKKQQD